MQIFSILSEIVNRKIALRQEEFSELMYLKCSDNKTVITRKCNAGNSVQQIFARR
jgi:hypothetical protein